MFFSAKPLFRENVFSQISLLLTSTTSLKWIWNCLFQVNSKRLSTHHVFVINICYFFNFFSNLGFYVGLVKTINVYFHIKLIQARYEVKRNWWNDPSGNCYNKEYDCCSVAYSLVLSQSLNLFERGMYLFFFFFFCMDYLRWCNTTRISPWLEKRWPRVILTHLKANGHGFEVLRFILESTTNGGEDLQRNSTKRRFMGQFLLLYFLPFYLIDASVFLFLVGSMYKRWLSLPSCQC